MVFGLAGSNLQNVKATIEFGTATGSTLVFSAHLLLVFALIGIYYVQDNKNGLLGLLGMILSVIGTIASTAVVYVEISGASGNHVDFVYAAGIPNIIHSVLPLLFVIGLVLFAVSIIKAHILPRTSGYFLIVGTLVFVAASFTGNNQPIIEVLGAIFTGLGFIIAGFPLIITRDKTVESND